MSSAALAADESLIAPANKLAADAPEWRELAACIAQRGDTVADFEEQRFFPFRKDAVVLRGEVRVSPARGLSLHYTAPDERTMIIDDRGLLFRDASGKEAPPPDPRANAANVALRHILRFDFSALAPDFEIYGRRSTANWSLVLVPRAASFRSTIGNIFVEGNDESVRRIELRRSAKQHIDIVMSALRPPAPFAAEELKRYFR